MQSLFQLLQKVALTIPRTSSYAGINEVDIPREHLRHSNLEGHTDELHGIVLVACYGIPKHT